MIRTVVKPIHPGLQQGPFIADLPPDVRLVQTPTTFRQPKKAKLRSTTELLAAIELELGLNNTTLTDEERLSEIDKRVHGGWLIYPPCHDNDSPNGHRDRHALGFPRHYPVTPEQERPRTLREAITSKFFRSPTPTATLDFKDTLEKYRWKVLEEDQFPDSPTHDCETLVEGIRELEFELELDGAGTVAERIRKITEVAGDNSPNGVIDHFSCCTRKICDANSLAELPLGLQCDILKERLLISREGVGGTSEKRTLSIAQYRHRLHSIPASHAQHTLRKCTQYFFHWTQQEGCTQNPT